MKDFNNALQQLKSEIVLEIQALLDEQGEPFTSNNRYVLQSNNKELIATIYLDCIYTINRNSDSVFRTIKYNDLSVEDLIVIIEILRK